MSELTMHYHHLLLLIFFGIANALNVVDFGAKPDGVSDSTQPFLKAWTSACNSNKPSVMWIPRGRFLIKSVVFTGPCKNTHVTVEFQKGSVIVAPADYNALGKTGYWILFYKVSGLAINGGTLDARGASFWACQMHNGICPPGARSISFVGSSNVVVTGLTSLNSRMFHIAIDQSTNIVMQGIHIIAPWWSPNTDGIHTQSSSRITIRNSIIGTGDDCISLGPGSSKITINRILCGPGHGVSIGSLGESLREEGVENIFVSASVFVKTQNGVRIKSFGRPSNGFARNIHFRNIVMNNVENPIIIDQNYCPDKSKGCPNKNSGVQISRVTYTNIHGTSSTKTAMSFGCSASNACKGIKLQSIKLSYPHGASSYCRHAHGTTQGSVNPTSCLVHRRHK